MKMNWGIWLGIIGGGIGLLVGIGSALATGDAFAMIFVTAFVLVFVGLFWYFFKPIIQSNRLMKSGVQKQGKIISYSDTGVTINNSPQVKFTVELKDDFNRPYEVTTKTIISRLDVGNFYAGMPVVCRVDPNDKMKVAIETFGNLQQTNSASPGQQTVPSPDSLVDEWEKILQQNEDINMKIRNTGISAEAKIISASDLGPRVNGNNPFMQFYLEVYPGLKEPFYAEAKGVVSEQSLHKYQPGNKIFVKYMPGDLSRVSIDHS
jgi:hypothetical protein